MNARFHRIAFIAVLIAATLAACADTEKIEKQMTPRKSKPVGERHYGPIDPVVIDLPEEAVAALGGLGVDGKPVDKVYVYFRTANVVVYKDTYDLKSYIDSICLYFRILADNDVFVKEADVWAVQMQKAGTIEFVTMAATPAQVKAYAKSGNLKKFLADIDYLMIKDEIVPADKRVAVYETAAMPVSTSEKPIVPAPQ